jgi:hypothetical protein
VLRRALVVLGGVAIVGGVLLIAIGFAFPGGIDLVVTGVIVTLALVFERRGYRPRINRAEGKWESTDERFIDPSSGHLIEVRYNPESGERDYVDIGAPR